MQPYVSNTLEYLQLINTPVLFNCKYLLERERERERERRRRTFYLSRARNIVINKAFSTPPDFSFSIDNAKKFHFSGSLGEVGLFVFRTLRNDTGEAGSAVGRPYPYGDFKIFAVSRPYPYGDFKIFAVSRPYPYGRFKIFAESHPYPYGGSKIFAEKPSYPYGRAKTCHFGAFLDEITLNALTFACFEHDGRAKTAQNRRPYPYGGSKIFAEKPPYPYGSAKKCQYRPCEPLS